MRDNTQPFLCCPLDVTWVEWHQLFSLDEIYKFDAPTAKTIPALNNNLKFFLSATRTPPPERMWGVHKVRQFYELYRKKERKKNIRVSKHKSLQCKYENNEKMYQKSH